MKPYIRRANGKPNFWKVAVWCPAVCCWKDGKRQFDTEAEAVASCRSPGRYRLSFVEDGKPRRDLREVVV